MDIHAYPIDQGKTVPLVPAGVDREWMDRVEDRHANRCLPLTIANTAGWELLCPTDVVIGWNGGSRKEDLHVQNVDAAWDGFAASHFKHGIVTFHLGWMFRTAPGIDLWTMGSPNRPKHGIYPLSGLIETDWIPYPFTMNWQMTAPGRVEFKRGEPFCFITFADIDRLAKAQPSIGPLGADELLKGQHDVWNADRQELNALLAAGDAKATKSPWRRRYFTGKHPPGCPGADPTGHRHKLRLQPFIPSPGVYREGSKPTAAGEGPACPIGRREDGALTIQASSKRVNGFSGDDAFLTKRLGA